MSTESSPRTAQLTSAANIAWSNGSLFDGFALVGLAVPVDPDNSNAPWPQLMKGRGSFPFQRLPLWAKIPIIQGVFDSNSTLFFNADIDPPNTQYVAYFYDSANVRRGTSSGLFTVSADPTTVTIPTLTAPTAAGAPPTPET